MQNPSGEAELAKSLPLRVSSSLPMAGHTHWADCTGSCGGDSAQALRPSQLLWTLNPGWAGERNKVGPQWQCALSLHVALIAGPPEPHLRCALCLCSESRLAQPLPCPSVPRWEEAPALDILPSALLTDHFYSSVYSKQFLGSLPPIACLEGEESSGPCEIPWHSGSSLNRDNTASQTHWEPPCALAHCSTGRKAILPELGQSESFAKSGAESPGTLTWPLVRLWGDPRPRTPGITPAR